MADLQFRYGKNLSDSTAFSAGHIYLDTATNELWYDDPKASTKKHVRLFNNATTSKDGLMSSGDKSKLDTVTSKNTSSAGKIWATDSQGEPGWRSNNLNLVNGFGYTYGTYNGSESLNLQTSYILYIIADEEGNHSLQGECPDFEEMYAAYLNGSSVVCIYSTPDGTYNLHLYAMIGGVLLVGLSLGPYFEVLGVQQDGTILQLPQESTEDLINEIVEVAISNHNADTSAHSDIRDLINNHHSFKNIVVGSTTIAADAHNDSLTLAAGSNITLTPDANNDKVTIAASNNKVTQTVTTTDAKYPLLLAPSGQTATKTTTSYFDSGITLNPSTNILQGAKLKYEFTSADSAAALQITSKNLDVNIFSVGDYETTNNTYGYKLRYNGTGSGVENALTQYCDNQNGAEVVGWQLNQSGQMGIGTIANTNYRLSVNGSTAINGQIKIEDKATVSYDSTRQALRFVIA